MEAISKFGNNTDWITLVIFTSVLCLVIAKSFFYSRFLNFIILPFNNKYVFMYSKKDRLLNWFHVFFTLFQLLNFSLFLYLARTVIAGSDQLKYPYLFIIILGCLLIFLFVKIIVQLSNGFVFNNVKVITEFIFKKLSYLNHSSLVMFLANVLLAYVFKGSGAVVYITIFLIFLINSAGWITILRIHQKLITGYFFYFILYLCALEIAPIVIIFNYLIE